MGSADELLGASPGDHLVLFYRTDEELTDRVGRYLHRALTAGGVAIAIATPAHRLMLEGWLAGTGTDVATARARGRYLDRDATETVRRFEVAGWPDAAGFWQAISPLIRQANQSGQPVHVFGEMVSVLWDSGLVNGAIEVEAMWNELGGHYPFTLMCAYPAQSVSDDRHHDALTEVCRLHTATVGTPVG
jgi:MEDS: MEthanogen/methylotroph, DcmR Sensory domain